MYKFVGRDHGKWLEIGRNIHNNGQQAVEQWLQFVVSTCDQFVENLKILMFIYFVK